MFRWGLTVILLSLPMANFSSSAQSDFKSTINRQKENSPIICSYTCITIIIVKVSDKTGKKASDLRWTDFTIYENGVKQKIDDFMRVESSEIKESQAVYKIGYTPINDYGDGKFRKLTVKIQTKDGKILKGQVFPKGYVSKKRDLN